MERKLEGAPRKKKQQLGGWIVADDDDGVGLLSCSTLRGVKVVKVGLSECWC